MTYAPICIPTLNRYEHLKNCVESLARCPEAKETSLYIGLDYPPGRAYLDGYVKVKEYVETISGFKEVIVVRREFNFGPSKNLRNLCMMVYEKFDRAITTEDDNVFSPSFLRYMNMALEKYKDEKRVIAVAGYLPPIETGSALAQNECFFYDGYFPYGVGNWRNRKHDSLVLNKKEFNTLREFKTAYKIFKAKDYIFELALSMVRRHETWGDVAYSMHMILNQNLVLCPPKSLVRNTGLDGSGVNSGDSDPDDIMHQSIIECEGYVPVFPEKIEKSVVLSLQIDKRRRLTLKRRMALFLKWGIWSVISRVIGA